MVPTLYDLDYEELVFDIHEEMTGRSLPNSKTTTRYHYGIIAPTNAALQDLINNVITIGSGDSTRWPSFSLAPEHIKKIIVNTHMSRSPIFLSDIENGFLNGEWDTVFVDPASVIEKHYGSNATFFGVKRAIVPRAFTSITAPVYLRPEYRYFMNALEFTGMSPILKRRNANYSFFVVEDARDYKFQDGDQSWITNRILNQVGTFVPGEKARKEFIPTLGGNFIVYDTTRRPVQLQELTDNGKTYAAQNYFRHPRTSLFWRLYSDFPAFFDLMNKAGMLDINWGRLNFTNENELYTIFVPSSDAMSDYNTDTLSLEELQQFIRYHFVRGDLIFTDGNKPPGDYKTLRVDESSHPYNPRFLTLNIQPEPDRIRIYDDLGNHTCDVTVYDRNSNTRTAVRRQWGDYATTGVIHEIDTILLKLNP